MPVQNQRRQYPTQPASVALARAQVREFLEGWGVTEEDNEHAQNAILIVSELAANAVLHSSAESFFFVGVGLGGDSLTISVRDDSPQTPLKRTAKDEDQDGRGLFLVSMLARDWGWRTEAAGKTVWAELEIKIPTCSA